MTASPWPPLRLALAGATALASLIGAGTAAAAQTSPQQTSPCDYAPQLPQCVDALGPLVDVSRQWQAYQPATVQLVPISDYAGDPEDSAPPFGVGPCGGETIHPAADGSTVPAGTVVDNPPRGVPAPPGTRGPYCLLSYFATDFAPLCTGCHRMLIDFAGIPAGNSTSPGADGHWAARFNASQLNVTSPFDNHSPNIKNLCSDKFFNPAAGSDCTAYPLVDGYGLEFEGDSSIYHHFPLEGRYYNGPQYLAGNGTHSAPYHWVHGAYFDVDPMGTSGLAMWYSVGYRGQGDAAPDTDQSYGCLCEVPPVGHSAYTTSSPLADLSSAPGGHGGSGGSSHVVASNVSNATVTALPDTASSGGTAAGAGAAAAVALLLAATTRLRRRRTA